MSEENIDTIYETPSSDTLPSGDVESMLTPLVQTKPWVLLCAILGLISAGLFVLIGIFMVIGFSSLIPAGAEGSGMVAGMGVLYVVMGLIFGIPPYWLLKYSSAIAKANLSREAEDITLALTYQKSFWKFIGIVMAIYLGFLLIGILFAVIGGLSSL